MTALSKSIIITITGYIAGVIGQIHIYPLFDLTVSLSGILSLGIIFTVIAFLSNFISLKAIEYFENKEGE